MGDARVGHVKVYFLFACSNVDICKGQFRDLGQRCIDATIEEAQSAIPDTH